MREIKFRAWDKTYEHFHDGDLIRDYIIGEFIDNPEYVVTQFTGLTDENGVEIYEGDILSDHGDAGPLYIEYSNEHAAFVFVDKFDPFGTTLYTTTDISYGGFEIIGNIYENKELLEVTN